MTHLRVYFVLAALLSPTFVPSQDVVWDWVPVIVQPSIWDWLPQAAHLPNLGVHRIERKP